MRLPPTPAYSLAYIPQDIYYCLLTHSPKSETIWICPFQQRFCNIMPYTSSVPDGPYAMRSVDIRNLCMHETPDLLGELPCLAI